MSAILVFDADWISIHDFRKRERFDNWTPHHACCEAGSTSHPARRVIENILADRKMRLCSKLLKGRRLLPTARCRQIAPSATRSVALHVCSRRVELTKWGRSRQFSIRIAKMPGFTLPLRRIGRLLELSSSARLSWVNTKRPPSGKAAFFMLGSERTCRGETKLVLRTSGDLFDSTLTRCPISASCVGLF
jgi:hypothetical protein